MTETRIETNAATVVPRQRGADAEAHRTTANTDPCSTDYRWMSYPLCPLARRDASGIDRNGYRMPGPVFAGSQPASFGLQ